MSLEPVAYADRGTALTGWLARPAGPARAALVLFPTIVNHSPASERRAAMLAAEGFVVLVADYYGAAVDSAETAGALSAALKADVDHFRARLFAAVDALRAHPAAAGLPLAAVGYCQGGQAVLELARAGADLAFVASFHGLLSTGRRASPAAPHKPRVLVCHGDADPMAPRGEVLALWEEFDAAGLNWHFHSYAGVRHGFTDPANARSTRPAIAYDASADRQSWAALLGFAAEVLQT
ncbi:dienelactone hydrolase family protein [Novosphingobium bradum]|uniref:Dienelactone hydrolase family protein n=1 Tax=Novosphingobium bradum TaxID=1737444 RepID=A0ABV7INY1_9SPHN